MSRHEKLRAQRHMDVLVQYIAAAVNLPRFTFGLTEPGFPVSTLEVYTVSLDQTRTVLGIAELGMCPHIVSRFRS